MKTVRKECCIMKPIVGVMPLWDDEKESMWMLPGYPDAVRNAGGIPVIFPLTEDPDELKRLMDLCDGFLFTGGHDVSPQIYREEAMMGVVETCAVRDEMELFILREALRADKPVLGICRGIQFINAALGGTLYQDLPIQHPSETEHHQSAPYDVPVHDVFVMEDSPLYDLLGKKSLQVNSYHHQAVRTLAPQLMRMAVSPDDLTEAVCMPGKHFVWAVQWHPEFNWKTDEESRKIFRAFIESMEK